MTQTTTQLSFDTEGFNAFLDQRDEPEWLTQIRRDAWAHFEKLPWPSQRDEEWMRTDIRLFKLGKFHLNLDSQDQGFEAVLSQGVELAGHASSHDGVGHSIHLEDRYSDQGILFGPISELASEHEDIVRKYLMTRAFQADYDKFAALHAAFWSTGTMLYVPRGVKVDLPLHMFSAMSDGGSDFSHTLVVLEDGAEATLLSENASGSVDHGGFHCGGVELIVGDNAHLRYVNLQDWGQNVWHFAHQKAIVGKDSTIQWTIGALGSKLAKVNQHVALVGEGAHAQVNGTMFTENKQHLSYHTLQQHCAPHCTSDFLYKAALQDQSRTVWRGMIKVDEDAQKTDGYQRNDNLLLSAKSRADSIPGLESEADDVRCTHGSTSGRVDEELIFYARCRGFTRKEAIQMIVTGFFQQIFDRITIESVREALGTAISRRVREYE